MNVTAEREVFEVIIRGMPEASRLRLLAEFDALAAEHADPQVTDKGPVEARIHALQRAGAISSQEAPGETRWLYVVISGVILLSFVTLWLYFWGIGPQKYILIETTRPVLVFTLIIAMLGFGGALIFRSLFTRERPEDFQPRFRLAREIFLVYSGIFGTIIGFYFGAASGEAANAAPPTISGASVQADGMLMAQIEGGTAPFTGTVRLEGDDDDRSLVVSGDDVSIQLDRADDCPAGAKISIRDSDSQSAELIVQDTAAALFDQGWQGCEDEAAEEAGGGTDNTANEDAGANVVGNAG